MPTENRSSNTEMVSVPPYIGLEPLVGRYYPAQCRRCGWVGSSEELTEDDAQCTRDVGDRLCLGDCDELERHDLLNIIQAMAAPEPHPEPIAWMVGTAFWWTKEEAERDAAATGLPIVGLGAMTGAAPAEQHQGEPVAWIVHWAEDGSFYTFTRDKTRSEKLRNDPEFISTPLYTHADPGEVERCEARLHEVASLCASVEQERDTLRAKLAERDALLREAMKRINVNQNHEFVLAIEAALSASAEPSVPECKYCGDTGQIMVGRSGDASDGNAPIMEPCEDCVLGAPVERDELRIQLEAMCKLWPEDLSDDGSGRMGFKPEVLAVVKNARAALERKPS